MFFAGLTAVLAKYGLQNINADLGLGIRTTAIFVMITAFNLIGNKYKDIGNLSLLQLGLLVASALATTISWVFYYRAMKEGLVSYVAAIDKGSIVITLLLSFLLLKEPVTAKVIIGSSLIVIGMIVLVWK